MNHFNKMKLQSGKSGRGLWLSEQLAYCAKLGRDSSEWKRYTKKALDYSRTNAYLREVFGDDHGNFRKGTPGWK